jgi:hypothetical protein
MVMLKTCCDFIQRVKYENERESNFGAMEKTGKHCIMGSVDTNYLSHIGSKDP